jgi:hypothetical protein
LEELGVDGRIILGWILEKWDAKVWIGFICLRVQTKGGALVNTVMTFGVP